ncbi:MAG: recombination regulator RecX [Lachnospiraceae bacterium]|nr:recombination regulator RecX [Lachnospiraceae bacterium]
MTVTDIVEISKSKVKIWIDNEAAFVLYKGELRQLDIIKGKALSEECFHHIMKELLVKRARLRCLNLLKGRDYTKYQLTVKLRQGSYPESVIENAVDYVASYGYIDDVRYAQSYIKYAGNAKSKNQIEYDLQKKGVSKQDIKYAYMQCAEKNIFVDEMDLIEKFMRKKNFQKEASTIEERRKMTAFLYRKGFSWDNIRKAVGEAE